MAEQLKDLKPGVVGSLHAYCSLTAIEVVSRKLGPVQPMCTPRVVAVVLWLRYREKLMLNGRGILELHGMPLFSVNDSTAS